MKYYYKPAYLKSFDKLSAREQDLAVKTDLAIKQYLETARAPFGLRVKSLRHDIFEARLNDKLRVVWVKDGSEVTFALLGNHEEVLRFLKSF